MRVDVRALGEFNRLADRGARRAAAALSQLTGAEIGVEVTDICLLDADELDRAFAGRDFVGVQFGLDGGLAGEAALAFERSRAGTLRSALLPDDCDERLVESCVSELGNIGIGGFLDGWANHLGAAIDVTPPTYVEARGAGVLSGRAPGSEGRPVFLFGSRLEARDADLEFSIYLLPEYDSFARLLAAREGERAVPAERLATFDSLARRGAASAADNVGALTGLPTSVEVSRLRFVSLADVPAEVGPEPHVGVVFELVGRPSGYFVALFDEPSAARVAGTMLPTPPDEPFGAPARSALTELCNIVTSGFVDGWANVLGTSIEHSPPELRLDSGDAILRPLVDRLARRREYGFVIDSTVEADGRRVGCDLYVLPREEGFAGALASLPAGSRT